MGMRMQHLVGNVLFAPAPSAVREVREAQPRPDARELRPVSPATTTQAPRRLGQTATAGQHALALGGLQLLLGYEWLASGVDKLLYASFPATVGQLLMGTLQGGKLPAFFAAFLSAVVLPHSVAFGYLVEWGETLAGLGLLAGGLATLLTPVARRRMAPEAAPWIALGQHAIEWLAAGAALGAAMMGLSFYLLDGAPAQWLLPSVAFGGALDTGLMLAAGSVVLLADAIASGQFRRGRAATS